MRSHSSLGTAVQLNYYYGGDTICRQGNQANHLYIVNTGAVAELHQHIDGPDASPLAAEDAEPNKPKLLNVLGPGDYWGEVAILVQYRHYHSHVAKTFCTVCALSREKVLVRQTDSNPYAQSRERADVRACASVQEIGQDYPVFGNAMANLLRVFADRVRVAQGQDCLPVSIRQSRGVADTSEESERRH